MLHHKYYCTAVICREPVAILSWTMNLWLIANDLLVPTTQIVVDALLIATGAEWSTPTVPNEIQTPKDHYILYSIGATKLVANVAVLQHMQKLVQNNCRQCRSCLMLHDVTIDTKCDYTAAFVNNNRYIVVATSFVNNNRYIASGCYFICKQ